MPLWAGAGVDPRSGAFQETLTIEDGRPLGDKRRARVQARQTFVYASAKTAGFGDGWLPVAVRGFERFAADYRQPNGLFANAADAQGRVVDAACGLYEQDFALLAMAALQTAGASGMDWTAEALRTRQALEAFRHPAGGFRELGEHPFQANAHMHLFETALAWEEAGGEGGWSTLADELGVFALERFIDPQTGVLQEFFDASWRPITGAAGLVEPGHQFEWAWLLERWGTKRGEGRARAAARKLFQHGRRGVDPAREVAVNALWDDLSVRDGKARLWPQTEYLKAALILDEDADALTASRGLARYLDAPAQGAWRDKMLEDGGFIAEPAPASSFYHILVGLLELFGKLGQGG